MVADMLLVDIRMAGFMVPEIAGRQLCEQLDFALQYAVSLGREMLQAMQDLDRPPPPCVYTAKGYTSRAATPHSFVNKVG